MARTRFIKKTVSIGIADGSERELSLTIAYNVTPGRPDSWEEPGCDDAVEIEKVELWDGATELSVPPWLNDFVDADEALHDSLITEARERDEGEREDAKERRAEEDRDDRLREGATL